MHKLHNSIYFSSLHIMKYTGYVDVWLCTLVNYVTIGFLIE